MARTTTTSKNTARRDAPEAKTTSPELQPRWYVVDAEGKTLGRLSTTVASHLMGKHRPHYSPHIFFGDHVVVVNAEKIRVTGRKLDQKIYYWHTNYPGGLKELPLRKALAEHPVKVIQWAVEGMLPKNRIGKRMIRCLKLYVGPQHPHVAQRPEPLETHATRKSA